MKKIKVPKWSKMQEVVKGRVGADADEYEDDRKEDNKRKK